MSKLNRQSLRSTAMHVARVILGSTLLLSILSANLPSAAIASGPMCNLACCAGRLPHAAGSCMNGSCHAVLVFNRQKIHVHHEARGRSAEQLCGLPRLRINASRLPLNKIVKFDFGSSTTSDHSRGTSKSAPDQASLSSAVLTKTCQSDCGSCASGFTNLSRQRNTAALAYADRPRPPSVLGRGDIDYGLTRTIPALCRRGAPRGPPLSFS